MSNKVGVLQKRLFIVSTWFVLFVFVFVSVVSGAALAQISKDQKNIYNRNIKRFDFCGDSSSSPSGDESSSSSTSAGNYEYVEAGDIPKSGKTVGASIYGGSYTGGKWKPSNGQQGGGNDDTGIGNHDNPLPGTTSFAELSNGGGNDYSALGGLPNGTKLEIKYKDKVIIAEKADVGAGGGDVKGKPRAIDLWWEVVKFMDPGGESDLSSGVDVVEIHAVPKSTKVTDLSGGAAQPSASQQVSGSSCCTAGDSTDSSLSGSNNNAKALNFFISKGFSQHQSAGIVGNFIQESGGYNDGIIDPQIVEGGGRSKTVPPPTGPQGQPGYGIAQWTFPTRKENLKKFADEKNKPVYSLELQLEFVMHEMTEQLEKDLKKINGSNRDAIEEAALLFHKVYEGSADNAAQIQERVDSGVKALEDNGGSVSSGGGGGSGASSGECSGGGSGASTGQFIWPVDKQYGLTACWNEFRPYYNGGAGGGHSGLDIGAPAGAKVVAADGGTIDHLEDNGTAGYGKVIIIKHGDGKWTLYGHLSAFSVKKGDKVDQGDQIGKVGNTGASRGEHLHFNVQDKAAEQGVAENTLNPLDFLPKDGRDLSTNKGTCSSGSTGYK